MLNEDTKQEIRDRLAAIGKAMPEFRSRQTQRLMIAEVAKTLGNCPDPGTTSDSPASSATTLIAQAGTGTGKSLAYGLAGMVMAKRKGKKLVISSSTVALQEQLTIRDLPFFKTAAGMDVKIELAKGRTRYLCQYKLGQVIASLQQTTMFDEHEDRAADDVTDLSEVEAQALKAISKDFAAGLWDGDRDNLKNIDVDDDLWKTITTDRHGCLNRSCPNFKTCAQIAARKRLNDADVVVTNRDLLLADLMYLEIIDFEKGNNQLE